MLFSKTWDGSLKIEAIVMDRAVEGRCGPRGSSWHRALVSDQFLHGIKFFRSPLHVARFTECRLDFVSILCGFMGSL